MSQILIWMSSTKQEECYSTHGMMLQDSVVGFDNTWDVFTKLSYKQSSKLRFMEVIGRLQTTGKLFNPRYLYWDEGRNELLEHLQI